MGADRAVRVDARAARADPITVARAARRRGRAPSRPTSSSAASSRATRCRRPTGTALAELLGLPRVAVVTQDRVRPTGRATVDRELEGGLVDVVEVDTPALLTIQTGINQPRYANLRAIKQAEQQEIAVVAAGRAAASPPTGCAACSRRRRGDGRGDPERGPGGDRAADRRDRPGAAEVSVLVSPSSCAASCATSRASWSRPRSELGGPVTRRGDRARPGPARRRASQGVDEIVHVDVEADEFENDVYQAALEALIARAAAGCRPARLHRQRDGLRGRRWPPSSGSASRATCIGLARRGRRARRDAAPSTARRCTPSSSSRPSEPVLLLLRPTALAARASRPAAQTVTRARGRAAVVAGPPPRVRGGARRRRRHHDRRLPALDRPRHRREGGDPAVRAARGEAGRRALGLASARRRRLDAERAPGRPVRARRSSRRSTSPSASPAPSSTWPG